MEPIVCSWLGHVTVPTFYAIFVHVHDYHLARLGLGFGSLEGIVWMKWVFSTSKVHQEYQNALIKSDEWFWGHIISRNSGGMCLLIFALDPQISQGLDLSSHIAIHSRAHSLQQFMDCYKDSVILRYWSENLYVLLMIKTKTYEYGLGLVHMFTNILSSVC